MAHTYSAEQIDRFTGHPAKSPVPQNHRLPAWAGAEIQIPAGRCLPGKGG